MMKMLGFYHGFPYVAGPMAGSQSSTDSNFGGWLQWEIV
jgi:hypothetical protein